MEPETSDREAAEGVELLKLSHQRHVLLTYYNIKIKIKKIRVGEKNKEINKMNWKVEITLDFQSAWIKGMIKDENKTNKIR